MTMREIYHAMDNNEWVYFVDMKKYNVRKPVLNKNEANSLRMRDSIIYNGHTVVYTMPTVAKMLVTKYEELKKHVHGICPLDFKPVDMTTAFIDYGKHNPDSLFLTREEAEAKITPELIKRFVDEKFVKKYPQIAEVHPVLNEIFDLNNADDEELIED